MDATGRRQLGLFPDPARGTEIAPAAVGDEVRELGRRLPAEIRLGTSSWSFPGWAGIVFERPASRAMLARHGLAAYAGHPVLRSVGIDRTYYAPLAASGFQNYAAVVPDDFRFLVKAHELCTVERVPVRGRHGSLRGRPNPFFLDPAYATDAVIAPFQQGLGGRAGPLVFQFTPQRAPEALPPEVFAERLHDFLRRLPQGPLYAVEIRHAPWLTSAYAAALADRGAVPCLSVHPSLPPVEVQAEAAGLDGARALVVRWMLGAGQGYEAARRRYAPFDRIVDPDPATRDAIAARCLEASVRGRPAYVTINNKAEGSAPLSALALARRIVSGLPRMAAPRGKPPPRAREGSR